MAAGVLGGLSALPFDEAQDRLVAAFEAVGDVFSQYTLLVELSADLEPLTDEEKEAATLVGKCQSQVWVLAGDPAGFGPAAPLRADSDTLIVRGVLCCMLALLEGRTADEIGRARFDFVQRTELKDAFSDERLNGFSAIERTIKHVVAATATEGGEYGD